MTTYEIDNKFRLMNKSAWETYEANNVFEVLMHIEKEYNQHISKFEDVSDRRSTKWEVYFPMFVAPILIRELE